MDKEHLEELIVEGLTQAQMAERCSCSVSTIKRYLKLHGLKTHSPGNPDYKPLSKPYLEGLIAEGLSRIEMVKRCNRSKGSVEYWLDKHGLMTKGYKKAPFLCSCGETDPLRFYAGVKSKCKTCHETERTNRKRAHKDQLVREHGGQCTRCGYNRCIAALHFHHRDPSEKDPNFSNMRDWSLDRKRKELEKSDLLCANCYTEVHYM